MEPLYEKDIIEAVVGLDESLESHDALKVHAASEPPGEPTQSGKSKLLLKYGPTSNFFH